MRVVAAARQRSGAFDLEALEQATRDALRGAGAAVLERLLAEEEPDARAPVACACGASIAS